MKKITLWQWGLFCILGSIFSNAVAGGGRTRAEIAGTACVVFLGYAVGIALIIAHFVRKKKE